MALNDLGIEVPAATDVFDPDGDMRALGLSMEGRIVVPVANEIERDALATTLTPTPLQPLYVHRADAPAWRRTEWTEDGTTWVPISQGLIQAGSKPITIPSGSSAASETVTFAPGYSADPIVAASIGVSGAAYMVTRSSQPTSAGVTFTAHRPSGGSTGNNVTLVVNWIAFGA